MTQNIEETNVILNIWLLQIMYVCFLSWTFLTFMYHCALVQILMEYWWRSNDLFFKAQSLYFSAHFHLRMSASIPLSAIFVPDSPDITYSPFVVLTQTETQTVKGLEATLQYDLPGMHLCLTGGGFKRNALYASWFLPLPVWFPWCRRTIFGHFHKSIVSKNSL